MAQSSTLSRISHQWTFACSYRAPHVSRCWQEKPSGQVVPVTELCFCFWSSSPPQPTMPSVYLMHCDGLHLMEAAAGASCSQLEVVPSQLCAMPRRPHLSHRAVAFIPYLHKSWQSGSHFTGSACTDVATVHGGIDGASSRAQSIPERLDDAERCGCCRQREHRALHAACCCLTQCSLITCCLLWKHATCTFTNSFVQLPIALHFCF